MVESTWSYGLRSSHVTQQLGGPTLATFGFWCWKRLRAGPSRWTELCCRRGRRQTKAMVWRARLWAALARERAEWKAWLERELRGDQWGDAADGRASGLLKKAKQQNPLWTLGIKYGDSNPAWWLTLEFLALGRLRQEACYELKTSLDYTLSSRLA